MTQIFNNIYITGYHLNFPIVPSAVWTGVCWIDCQCAFIVQVYCNVLWSYGYAACVLVVIFHPPLPSHTYTQTHTHKKVRGRTYISFIVTGLKDELLRVMLPVLHRSGRGGLVGRTQCDGLTPLALLQRQPARHQDRKRIRQSGTSRRANMHQTRVTLIFSNTWENALGLGVASVQYLRFIY